MLLCVSLFNPLLIKLDGVPTGLRVGNNARKKEVATACADDVIFLLIDPKDVVAVQDTLQF